MSNLIFVNGDFSSGTTLLFTLFRKTGDFYCLYEPLHEKLLEYLVYPLRPDEHHPNVEPYYTEFNGFREVSSLFKPEWGASGLYLSPETEADDFYRYWSYLIGTAFGRKERVLIKENRLTFRLGWLRSRFPNAKIIHIYRDKDDQWNSVVKRGQEYVGKEDIGQADVMFAGFNIAQWCEELKSVYPELDARNFRTGYERFSKLWDVCYTENRKYADISVALHDLVRDFENTIQRIGDCIQYDFDPVALEPLVVPPEKRKPTSLHKNASMHWQEWIDKIGSKYSKARVRAESYFRKNRSSSV